MLTQTRPNAIEENGVAIIRTPAAVAVNWVGGWRTKPLCVEVYIGGRLLHTEFISPLAPWRNCFGMATDHLRCVVQVKDGDTLLAELGLPPEEFVHPFMVRNGLPQQHVTENYVSVPPALTVTDEVGAVWTLGFEKATREKSPDGEFAFPVLRDGIDTGEIASRIERRNGKVRVFTRRGWKRWTGSFFF